MRKILFIIVFLLSTQPLFAQDNWVLVHPTAEDYVQTIKSIKSIFTNPDNNNWEVRQYLRNAVVHEFQMRGWDVSQLSYDAIETLYIRIFDYGWEIHKDDFFGTI